MVDKRGIDGARYTGPVDRGYDVRSPYHARALFARSPEQIGLHDIAGSLIRCPARPRLNGLVKTPAVPPSRITPGQMAGHLVRRQKRFPAIVMNNARNFVIMGAFNLKVDYWLVTERGY